MSDLRELRVRLITALHNADCLCHDTPTHFAAQYSPQADAALALFADWLRERAHAAECAADDAGMGSCVCPSDDPRNVIDSLVDEARRLRRVNAEWDALHLELFDGLAWRNIKGRLGASYVGTALAEIDRLRAELSQVQKERDDAVERAKEFTAEIMRNNTGLSKRLSEFEASLFIAETERDEARSALAALRAEVGRVHDLVRLATDEAATLDASATRAAAYGHVLVSVLERLRSLVTDQSPAAPAANRCGATTWAMFELDRVQCVCQRPPGHEGPHDDRGTKWGLSPTSDTQTDRCGQCGNRKSPGGLCAYRCDAATQTEGSGTP